MRWVLLPTALLLLAGCAQHASVPDQPVDRSADMRDEPGLFQEPSQVVASVTYYMESGYQPPRKERNASDGAADGPAPTRPPPQNLTLNYHGVQPQFDGWGRTQPALVFSQSSTQASTKDGETETFEVRMRIALSAADWSILSVSTQTPDLELAVHPLPGTSGPATGGTLLFVAIQALEGDLTRELLAYDGPEGQIYLSFLPDAYRPLPGACDVWRIAARFEASPDYDPPEYDDSAAPMNRTPPRHLLCLEDGATSPLWTWFGSEADGGDFLQRTSPGILLPARTAEALPPVEYELQAWQQVDAQATFALDPPTALPPSGGADWAARLIPLVHALYTDRDYAEFASGNDPWVSLALDMPPQPLAGEAAEGTPGYLGVAGKQDAWNAFVIRVANPALGPSPGISIGGVADKTDELMAPEMPTAAAVQRQVAALLATESPEATTLLFGVGLNAGLGTSEASWVEVAGCTPGSDGIPSMTFVDAIRGYVPLVFRGPAACGSVIGDSNLTPAGTPLLAAVAPGIPGFAAVPAIPGYLRDLPWPATPPQGLAA